MKNKGITLIALVITIIVLLILAGITINLTIGEHGILTMAKEAGKNYQNAAEYEQGAIGKFFNEAQNIIAGGNGTGTNSEENDKPEEPGPWLLASKVKIGDYVAYDPTLGVSDTSKLRYTSPKGTGTSHGNGEGEQVFTARAYDKNDTTTTGWRVFKKNDVTGEVILISDRGIISDTVGGNGSGSKEFYLYGAIGYLYAEQELANISAIYGHGEGADTTKEFTYQTGNPLADTITTGKITGSGARSLNIDDINQITGYTIPEATTTKAIKGYYPTITTPTGKSSSTQSITPIETKYSYTIRDYVKTENMRSIFEIEYPTWLDNARIAYLDGSSISYGIGHVTYNNKVANNYSGVYFKELCAGWQLGLDEKETNVNNSAKRIRPIVYLKTTIKTSGQDENGAWTILDE